MPRSRRCSLEPLEDRCVPATFGNPWPDASHLTLSFAPDGTPLNGQTSSLFKTLNATASTASWERTILRAVQTWATVANLNVGLVNDGGQALGTSGRPQSDPRFGDIRIAAGNFSTETAAFSAPFAAAAGTNSGDVRLNSAVMGAANAPDLYTVLLHESGLVFGLPENMDTGSIMYTYYQGARTGLGGSDVTAIQSLYGPRPADPNAVPAGANPLSNATSLGVLSNSTGVLSLGSDGQLEAVGAQDAFKFQAPTLTGGMVITLGRAGLSLLTPKVTVYNSAGQVVGSAVSTDPTGGDLTIQVNNVSPLSTYYVTVQGATGDVFDVGSYHLNVQSLPVVNSLLSGATSTLGSTASNLASLLPTNCTFPTAQGGLPLLSGPTNQVSYSFRGTLLLPGQPGYFKVTAPAASMGDSVMSVMAWGVGSSQLLPWVSVYNAQQQFIPAKVLVNESGVITVQVSGVTAGASYYVKVSGPGSGSSAVGDYFLGVNYIAQAEQLNTLAASQLTPQAPSQQGSLTVTRSTLYHFILAADQNTGTGVKLTIKNSSGAVVGQLTVAAGQTNTLTLILPADSYTLTVSAFRSDGQAITPVNFLLQMEMQTMDTGPAAQDTSGSPSSGTSTSSSGSNYYSSSNPPPDSTYYYYDWSGSGPSSSNSCSTGYTTV